MIAYVDTSVLLRVIQGTPDVLAEWERLDAVSSYLVRVECLRTIDRARLQPGARELAIAADRATALDLLQRIRLAPVTDQVLDRAADPFPTALGSVDAIHLSTALLLREDIDDLAFATHDRQLAVAARSVGFLVLGS